jgi:hypothetical protein
MVLRGIDMSINEKKRKEAAIAWGEALMAETKQLPRSIELFKKLGIIKEIKKDSNG